MRRVIKGENEGQASEGEAIRSGRWGGLPGASRNIDSSGSLWTIEIQRHTRKKSGGKEGKVVDQSAKTEIVSGFERCKNMSGLPIMDLVCTEPKVGIYGPSGYGGPGRSPHQTSPDITW